MWSNDAAAPDQGSDGVAWTASATRPTSTATETRGTGPTETPEERIGREFAARIEHDQAVFFKKHAAYLEPSGLVRYSSDPDLVRVPMTPPRLPEPSPEKRTRSASAARVATVVPNPNIPTIADLDRVYREIYETTPAPTRWARLQAPQGPVLRQYPAVEGQPEEEARAYWRGRPAASYRPPGNPEAVAWIETAALPPESRPTQVDYEAIDPDLFEAPQATPRLKPIPKPLLLM